MTTVAEVPAGAPLAHGFAGPHGMRPPQSAQGQKPRATDETTILDDLVAAGYTVADLVQLEEGKTRCCWCRRWTRRKTAEDAGCWSCRAISLANAFPIPGASHRLAKRRLYDPATT